MSSIAFLGTSLTCKATSGAWLEKLQVDLAKAGKMVAVYDLGLGGATAAVGLTKLAPILALRPKVVVVEYGMNDALSALGISVAVFKANLGAIVDALAGATTHRLLMTANPAIAPGAAGVPNLALYYQGVRDVAAAKSVGLIDNAPLWGAPTSAQIPDGIHPTGAAAYAVMVPSIAAALLPLL